MPEPPAAAHHRLHNVTTGLYLISAICGLVDAVCFLALGRVFAEMMTGNLLLLAFSIGKGELLEGSAQYLPAIIAFTLGALLGGRILRGPKKMQERRVGFIVEWVLLWIAVAIAAFGHPEAGNAHGVALIAVLSFAMGIQNAMIRVHGVPDLATNVMTLTYTGIVADSAFAGGDNRNWRRRALSIGLFFVSDGAGALLLSFGLVWPLLLACVIFSVAMLPLLFGQSEAR
jgi:uncharacterized membrane protein YoaK (UPF0700 family)